MKLVTLTGDLSERFGDFEALRLIAEAGFDGYDYSMFGMVQDENILNTEDYKKHIESVKRLADELGIECRQAHAPFATSAFEDDYNEKIYKRLIRSIEIAGFLGAHTIVIHPNQHLEYCSHKEELFKMNMKFYKSLIPYAEKANIKIAVENMYRRDPIRKVIIDSVCSHADEFCRYIDELGSPYITACLDLGHCVLVSDTHDNMITRLGSRLGALHVHDNKHTDDDHTIPYAGCFDWDRIAKKLAEINYAGDFTFEADSYYKTMDDEFIPVAIKFLHDTGRHLISLIEKAKKH